MGICENASIAKQRSRRSASMLRKELIITVFLLKMCLLAFVRDSQAISSNEEICRREISINSFLLILEAMFPRYLHNYVSNIQSR